MTRRSFLKSAIIGGGGFIVGVGVGISGSPQATEKIVVKEVPVEKIVEKVVIKEVEVEKIVEKVVEVEKVVTKLVTPTPAPISQEPIVLKGIGPTLSDTVSLSKGLWSVTILWAENSNQYGPSNFISQIVSMSGKTKTLSNEIEDSGEIQKTFNVGENGATVFVEIENSEQSTNWVVTFKLIGT